MSDLSKFLPLSHRSGADETAVSRDWRLPTAASLDLVIGMLAPLDSEEWKHPSLRVGWSVGEVAARLDWYLGATTRDLLAASARRAFGRHPRVAAVASQDEVIESLRTHSRGCAAGRGRGSVAELAEVVVDGYVIARSLDRTLDFGALATGAVALARASGGSLQAKAVLRGHILKATDDGWQVGHGTVIEGTAAQQILALYGYRAGPS